MVRVYQSQLFLIEGTMSHCLTSMVSYIPRIEVGELAGPAFVIQVGGFDMSQ
jgi:hypothetical protein